MASLPTIPTYQMAILAVPFENRSTRYPTGTDRSTIVGFGVLSAPSFALV